jgi:hypothetical protein
MVQKTVALIFLASGIALNFFAGGGDGCFHIMVAFWFQESHD